MPRLSRLLSLAVLVCLAADLGEAVAGSGADCEQTALGHLRAASPDGYAIYEQLGDPASFATWLRCEDAQFDLSTAVHESTHLIAAETDAFPLVGGGVVKRPHEVSRFFPPSRIAKRFKSDDFTTIYLRLGKASSSTDFLYLLDELNAYTHDLNAAADLKALKTPNESVDHRDGLAAMMAFVAVYAETAKDGEPGTAQARTWRGLREAPVAGTIAELWGRAERVMSASCGIPNFGTADKGYIRHFCDGRAQAALTPILGRAPVCPTACLAPAFDLAQANGAAPLPSDGSPPTSAESRSTAGPAWIRNVIRFQERGVSADAETR